MSKDITIWIGKGNLSARAINYFGEYNEKHEFYMSNYGIFTALIKSDDTVVFEGHSDFVLILEDVSITEKKGYFFHGLKWTTTDFHNAILCLGGDKSKCPQGIQQTTITTNNNGSNGNGLGLFDFDLCRFLLPKSLEDKVCSLTWLWGILGGVAAYKTLNSRTKIGQLGFGTAAAYCFIRMAKGKPNDSTTDKRASVAPTLQLESVHRLELAEPAEIGRRTSRAKARKTKFLHFY